MSRIQYRDIEVIETVEMQELAAVYGAGLFGNVFNWVKNNWRGVLQNVFQIVPINKNFNIAGFNVGVQANGQGVAIQGNRGGFNFGFGFNW